MDKESLLKESQEHGGEEYTDNVLMDFKKKSSCACKRGKSDKSAKSGCCGGSCGCGKKR
ncbi:hypothetical protein [Clostridium sp.]|uniref:hypothetical protein n=1 Tax=Clostridium sp. TaxID=1506 RepID=UPI003463DCB5